MRAIPWLIALMAALFLAACGEEEHQDIKEWMREASRDLKGKVPPLPEIKPLPAVTYEGGVLTDPFSGTKIVPQKSAIEGANAPDPHRPKQRLEAFPLESLKIVGIHVLGKGSKKTPYAMVQAGTTVYPVAVGEYMGQSDGRVIAITDTEVKVKERIKDPTGQTDDWVDRPVSLYLEGEKK